MERCGYFIETKDLHAGLKCNDKDEFPDLNINEGLPDIDSPSYKQANMDCENNVDLVQELPTEENMQKLLKEEYNENDQNKSDINIGHAEFQRIIDDHIGEINIREKNQNLKNKIVNDDNKKSKKKAELYDIEEETKFDMMMQEIKEGGLSDNEDGVDMDGLNIIKTEKPIKALNNLVGENIEMVTKWRKGKEYESEQFTSSAGGKLIINTIKKKGKKNKKTNENKENFNLPITEEKLQYESQDLDHNELELIKGDNNEMLDIEEVEEYVEEPEDSYCSEDEEFSDDSYSELPKLERQIKKDAKRPDYIDGMKVLKYEESQP